MRPGPRVVSDVARGRNRPEDPPDCAGAHVVGADVPRRRGAGSFRDARAEDQHVLVDRPRRVRQYIEAADITAEAVEQRDAPVRAERRNRLAGARVERVEALSGRHQDAAVVTSFPEHHPAVHAKRAGAGTGGKRVEDPQLTAGRRIEREGLQLRRRGIEHAVDDNRVALDLRAVVRLRVARAVGPRHLQAADVAGVDLVESRELPMAGIAAVHRPVERQLPLGRATRARGHRRAPEHDRDRLPPSGQGFAET